MQDYCNIISQHTKLRQNILRLRLRIINQIFLEEFSVKIRISVWDIKHIHYICSRKLWLMVKYTHLIERCSGFLKTGVAWRLKEHGYTFSEAYWRLREGKGLLSSYDQESLKMWSNLITSVRRDTGALRMLSSNDQTKLKDKRNKLLEKMESYRDKLENGSIPLYIWKCASIHY